MADLSLDELIRRRGFNAKGTHGGPVHHRIPAAVGRTFDARQKIGASDVKLRLGGGGGTAPQIKDAREKLAQKDARFRIRRGEAGGQGVQDARQMINSRKRQGLNSAVGVALPQKGSSPMIDARSRLSLKRSVAATPSPVLQSSFKITKTIQRPIGMTSGVRINVPVRSNQSVSGGDDATPSKQMKLPSSSGFLHAWSGSDRSPLSLSGPITKVVQNDSYTGPPLTVAPKTSGPPVSSRPTAATSQPMSRTLVNSQAQQEAVSKDAVSPLAAAQAFSPLEGTKMTVNNLHPSVTEDDVVELFCACGALKRARLISVGVAEVVFVKKEDAVTAYRKYNNRCLDGQPMKCNLHMQGNLITSEQSILLRLSDTPGGGGTSAKKDGMRSSLSRPGGRPASSRPSEEVDPQTILKALFKSSSQAPSSESSASTQATAFRIKI